MHLKYVNFTAHSISQYCIAPTFIVSKTNVAVKIVAENLVEFDINEINNQNVLSSGLRQMQEEDVEGYQYHNSFTSF